MKREVKGEDKASLDELQRKEQREHQKGKNKAVGQDNDRDTSREPREGQSG